MPTLVPIENDPFNPTPLEGPGMMPPGTTPSRMVAQEGAPDANMVPLSAQAQQAQRMLPVMGMMGDRAGVMSQKDILDADPTYLARKNQALKMGDNAALLSSKQQAATRIYQQLNSLEQKMQAWKDHAPSAFNAGTGPYNSNEWMQLGTGWANRGGQAFNTLLNHDIKKLAGLYRDIPGGVGGQGTDSQDTRFEKAMGEWISAPDPDTAFAILQSAKEMIRAKGGLPGEFDTPKQPLSAADIAAINHYAATPITPDSPFVSGGLKVGTVRKGYAYQGGIPGDPASWKKVGQ